MSRIVPQAPSSLSDQREARVAEAALLALPTLGGPVLVVEDEGRVGPRLDGEVTRWSRVSEGGRAGTPWPAEGPFKAATLRLPLGHQHLVMIAHAIAARLSPGGRLYVYGGNDEGIRSAPRKLEAAFGEVKTLATLRKCRVLVATAPRDDLKGALDDWIERGEIDLDGRRRPWVWWPGIFAGGQLDPATAMLVAALPPMEGRVLDFGCGAGVIAAALIGRQPGLRVDALDHDALAVEATRRNVPGAAAILGEGWAAAGLAPRYAAVISNPPFHKGKSEDFAVVRGLIEGAARRADALWIVTQRQIPLQPLLAPHFAQVEIVAGDSKNAVWRCRSPRPPR